MSLDIAWGEGLGAPPFGILFCIGDPAFAVNDAGHIVGWNAAAERLFDLKRDQVLGHQCHGVLGCRDLWDGALSPASCPLLQAEHLRRPLTAIDLLVRHRRGHTLQVSANTILFPADIGLRALVLLRPSACGVIEEPPKPTSWPGDEWPISGQGDATTPIDLAKSLDRLLLITDADAAELFLAVPPRGQLALAAHRGAAPRAFRQIVCFDRGQGFPGLVAQSGQPLLSLDLPSDSRYLRTEVKRQGFRFYLCVPVWGNSGFLGSLHIASRRHADTVAPHLPFLTHVARDLGPTLERYRLYAAEPVTRHLFDPTLDASTNLRRAADQALRALIELTGVDCGALLLSESTTGTLQPMSEWEIPPRLHRTLARACNPTSCPALKGQRCVLPAEVAEAEWPFCHAVRRDLAAALCLPLKAAGKSLGVLLLGCRHREPLPTRHLSFVYPVVNHIAVLIHNAQVALEQEQEARQQALPSRGREAGPSLAQTVSQSVSPARREASIPFLDLRCLGKFAMFNDGRPVPSERFARRRSLTALKILLTRYGKQIHREELKELLWPEKEPDVASTLLNVAVHYLRRGLEPNLLARQPSHFISSKGEYYAFSTEAPHRLDSQEFLKMAESSSRLETAGRWAEAIEACLRAVALYAGDFLEEELYSDWCAFEREYLRETFLIVLKRAARLHLSRGDLDATIACYRRALRTDPTLEEVHRALMEALWRAGRRDEALRQYRECRAILERELGIAPLPETEALRQQIASDA